MARVAGEETLPSPVVRDFLAALGGRDLGGRQGVRRASELLDQAGRNSGPEWSRRGLGWVGMQDFSEALGYVTRRRRFGGHVR